MKPKGSFQLPHWFLYKEIGWETRTYIDDNDNIITESNVIYESRWKWLKKSRLT